MAMGRLRVFEAALARKGALVALALAACVSPPPAPSSTALLRGPELVFGEERYSAWFADERDGVVYFGLSPFWTELWRTGDPAADRRHAGPHLIGRFALDTEAFLAPLVARAAAPEVRASVWDVLAHPNGWIYYTTFFEEMGRVHPGTGAVERFDALGLGLNELAVGPDGAVYATRYGSQAAAGALVVLEPDGRLRREIALHTRDGTFTAAKSVAVDPRTGRVLVNADVLHPDGPVTFAYFAIDAARGEPIRAVTERELLFAAYDPSGRGALVEAHDGRVHLTLVEGERTLASADLGPRDPNDFAQDIHFADDGTAAIAFWSGRIELARERGGRFERASLRLDKPEDCGPPAGRSLVYSAFAERERVYATLYCGVALLRAGLPHEWTPFEP
jgi:hypothetical protein